MAIEYADSEYEYDVEDYRESECWIVIGVDDKNRVVRYNIYDKLSENEKDQKEFKTAKECIEKIEELKELKIDWIKEYRIIHKINIETEIKL